MKMTFRILARYCLILVILYVVNAQTKISTKTLPEIPDSDLTTKPKATPNRVLVFAKAFVQAVQRSPQVLKIFDASVPIADVSKYIFQTYSKALKKSGANNPDSLSKFFADSVHECLPSLSQNEFIYVVGHSMGIFMLSQGLLTLVNPALCAQEFSNAIEKNCPNHDVTHLDLIDGLSKGIVDYLQGHGSSILKRSASFVICAGKNFYTHSLISQPLIETPFVDIVGSISTATEVYGIESFTSAFISEIESSDILQSLFYSNETVPNVVKAWKIAASMICDEIGCYSAAAYPAESVLSETFKYMSKNTYTKAIVNAYAIMLLQMGILRSDNGELQSQIVTKAIEDFLTKLSPNADLSSKIVTIFEALIAVVQPETNVLNIHPTFSHYLQLEFYASTPARLQILLD